jgi:hypothetical protein
MGLGDADVGGERFTIRERAPKRLKVMSFTVRSCEYCPVSDTPPEEPNVGDNRKSKAHSVRVIEENSLCRSGVTLFLQPCTPLEFDSWLTILCIFPKIAMLSPALPTLLPIRSRTVS